MRQNTQSVFEKSLGSTTAILLFSFFAFCFSIQFFVMSTSFFAQMFTEDQDVSMLEGDYKCPICSHVLPCQKDFTAHLRGHNEVKPSPDPSDPTGQAKV